MLGDETSDDWVEYVERLEHFFKANEIDTEDKKKSIMLSSCGSKTYKLFRSLLTPVKPGDTSWEDLKEIMENHQNPKPSVTVERYKFNKRDRKIGESVPFYTAELRKLSEHWKYDNNLNDMLRDCLVCGIQDTKIQQKLLSESELTLSKAFKIATAMERAHNGALDIQKEDKEIINRFSAPATRLKKTFNSNKSKYDDSRTCFLCGNQNHSSDQCYFKEAECFKCKVGHIAKKMTNK